MNDDQILMKTNGIKSFLSMLLHFISFLELLGSFWGHFACIYKDFRHFCILVESIRECFFHAENREIYRDI